MKKRGIAYIAILFAVTALWLLNIYFYRTFEFRLARPAFFSGWTLTAVILYLASLRFQKKIGWFLAGDAVLWKMLHIAAGVLALAFFWIHTRTLWPQGFYEQILAGFFYLVSFSGFVGLALQWILPHQLTKLGIEVIYERIPEELAQLRKAGSSPELIKKLERHQAIQRVLKGWILFHAPLTAGLLALIIWHIVVVYLYAH